MNSFDEIKKRIWKDIKTFGPAGIIFVIYAVVFTLLFGNTCPMVLITGFPCPGCGVTRSTFCLLTGHLSDSFRYNPTTGLWILVILVFLIDRYAFGRISRKVQTGIFAAVALITIAVYVYRMICFFPGEPPLVYTKNNLLFHIIYIIKLLIGK